MSKVVRQKHLNIIKLLMQATDVTDRLLKEGKLQHCLLLLADCQESAVALGGHIEKLYGVQTKTVTALEQYCECLYQFSVAMDEGAQMDVAYESLQQAMKQVQETYEQEFPDKKEVVFLPYKAAMWDSLESVWKAADEDPDCDAYVIPIPYYDLDGNQNFKEMHYEGDLYPKYVPITSYEKYDLEERHPDIIFIHNPYDEYNRVTRIEPKFFSSKIKEYTEKLVYIPYFVLNEIDPTNEAAIEGMSHFCYLPGTMYADQVIVQSEDMRQIYINEYLKAAKRNGVPVTREELEKRILGLGSPKFDKALNTKLEDLEIPEEWLRIIEKEDGSWKKIIFYNTSLSSFLENSEQMLEKIKDVLRIFKKNKEEVALLWRPHPLMIQTIESMRPELRDAYMEIVQQYREEMWGIYDDTPDMNRAVTISDGYYGDWSSLVKVYQETGKPVMIQNVYSLEDINNTPIMDNMCEYDNQWWFVSLKDDCLYKMSKTNYKIDFVCRLKKEINTDSIAYSKSYIYKDKMFILPWENNCVAIYDFTKEVLRYIELPISKGYEGLQFLKGMCIGSLLYLIPCEYNRIVCIDMENEEIKKEYESISKDNNITYGKNLLAWGEASLFKDSIVFGQLWNDEIIEFNIKKEEKTVYKVLDLVNGCSGVLSDNNGIWFVPRKAEYILRWEKNKMSSYQKFPIGYRSGDISFHKCFYSSQGIYLLPRDANMILFVDRDGDIKEITLGEEKKGVSNFAKYMPYSCILEEKEGVYLYSSKGILHVIQGDKCIKSMNLQISPLERAIDLQGRVFIEKENQIQSLVSYIMWVKRLDSKVFAMKTGNFWESIFDVL